MVAATPCPLILAAPAAFIAGVSQAARRGILIKGGGPLEALARFSRDRHIVSPRFERSCPTRLRHRCAKAAVDAPVHVDQA
jgi:hypothetical protein